jgi:DNA-binding HxlR family transcriptional regulator
MANGSHEDCGFETALNVIAGKWKADILWEVNTAPRRFGQLRRVLTGISEKVLARQLKVMEGDGLISRKVLPGRVVYVEYSATALGRSLNASVTTLSRWGKDYERSRPPAESAREAILA